MPTLFTFFGLRFYFPVVRVVENHGFKKAVLKKAEGIVRSRQFEILKAWDECFNKK